MVMTAALSLKDIIQYEIPILPFRKDHLKRKPKIVLIGMPGSGKSVSYGFIILNQFMLWGEPCWSNLPIKHTYTVTDNEVAKYGIKGGEAVFESKKIDKYKLIRLNKEYYGGVIGLDEVNVEFADAMKTTSNVNFYFDQADQQLRHSACGLVCTSIDEMWISPRLRDITDYFIICKDMALTPGGLQNKQEEGLVFRWNIYPMTDMYNGVTWNESKTILTMYFHAQDYWGIINTSHSQTTGNKYAVDVFKNPDEAHVDNVPGGVNKAAVKEYSRWGKLYEAVQSLRDEGIKRLPPGEMWKYLHQFYPDTDIRQLGAQLSYMGVKRAYYRGNNGGDYIIDGFKLEEPINEKVLAWE